MQQAQIKTLLVNTMTAAIVVGVFVAGYFVFVKEDTTDTTKVVSVARIAEKTTSIGAEIDYTVKSLEDLDQAVASSKVIFDLPAFKNLQNFSVVIPAETIGRANPFVPTEWKLKMKASDGSASKTPTSATEDATPQPASLPASVSSAPTQTSVTSGSLLGDLGQGI